MTWVETAELEALKTTIKHTASCLLISTVENQRIIWANQAFCNWSKYTLTELQDMAWTEISIPDESLEADIQEAKALTPYQPSYSVRKRYIPKGAKPEWGTLHVLRYPLQGDLKYCICTWEPLKNGTAESFAATMEFIKELKQSFAELQTTVTTAAHQSDEDRVVLGIMSLLKAHPKIALALLIAVLSIFGLNNVIQLLQGTGFIPAPIRQVEVKDVNKP